MADPPPGPNRPGPGERLRQQVRRAALLVPPLASLRDQRDALAARVAELEEANAGDGARSASVSTRLAADHPERTSTQPVGIAGEITLEFPLGHYYSPIPDLAQLATHADEVFAVDRPLPRVDLREPEQLALLDRLATSYHELPYPESGPHDRLRYRYDNPYFGHADGIAYFLMLRTLRPQRIVEVGSGWSSALCLDVCELFDDAPTLTFVEPYTERLEGLLRGGDTARVDIVRESLQTVPLSLFDELHAGDVLFIDSTHVSRVGSDVNRLFLEVIPRLRPGVLVHVHDIFFPFEYPHAWVTGGRAWNEAYLLHALLIGGATLQIDWFNSMLAQRHADRVTSRLPLWGRHGGGSIWLHTVG